MIHGLSSRLCVQERRLCSTIWLLHACRVKVVIFRVIQLDHPAIRNPLWRPSPLSHFIHISLQGPTNLISIAKAPSPLHISRTAVGQIYYLSIPNSDPSSYLFAIQAISCPIVAHVCGRKAYREHGKMFWLLNVALLIIETCRCCNAYVHLVFNPNATKHDSPLLSPSMFSLFRRGGLIKTLTRRLCWSWRRSVPVGTFTNSRLPIVSCLR